MDDFKGHCVANGSAEEAHTGLSTMLLGNLAWPWQFLEKHSGQPLTEAFGSPTGSSRQYATP
jgi:hypothetical protein